MLGSVGQGVVLSNHARRARIADAVVELLLGEAPRERDEHRAGPLGRPVEQGRLEAVVEDDRYSVAGLHLEPACDPRDAR